MANWEVPWIGKVFVALIFLEVLAFIVAGTIGIDISANDDSENAKELSFISKLAIFVALGLCYFAVDSILQENILQFLITLGIHTYILAFVIYHHVHIDLGFFYRKYSLGLVIGCGALEIIYMIMCYFILDSFANYHFKRVGGSIELQKMDKTASQLFSLIKLDVLFGLLLVVLAGFYAIFTSTEEASLNVFALAMTLLWGFLGWNGVIDESKTKMRIFFLLAIAEPIYICLKLFDMKDNPNDYPEDSMTLFISAGIFALFERGVLLVWGYMCFKNFDKGLREVFIDNAKNDICDAFLEYIRPLCSCSSCCQKKKELTRF